jgi:hypothetical protein
MTNANEACCCDGAQPNRNQEAHVEVGKRAMHRLAWGFRADMDPAEQARTHAEWRRRLFGT